MGRLISNSLLFLLLALLLAASVLAQSPAPKKSAKPLSEAEVMEGLSGGISSKRLATLVTQYGVDFKLTAEDEQRLRGVGADDGLLLAIHNAEPKAGELLIDANADCSVDVNGNVYVVSAGEKKKVEGIPGDNLIEAKCKGESAASWRKVVTMQAAEQKIVLIEFPAPPPQVTPPITPPLPAKPRIDPAEETWAALRESKDPALLEDFAKQFPNSPFAAPAQFKAKVLREEASKPTTDSPNVTSAAAVNAGKPGEAVPGTWIDPATGLMWTVKDKGAELTWYQASEYCGSLDAGDLPGWRLPTNDELRSMYDHSLNASGAPHIKRGIKVENWAWTRNAGKNFAGSGSFFNSGAANAASMPGAEFKRALCVRRP